MSKFILPGALPCDQDGIPLAATAPPLSSEIINGSSSTDGATLVTIAANMVVLVSITMAGSQATASTHGTPTVTTVGATVVPAAGSVIAALNMQTNNGISAVSQTAVTNDIYVYAGTSSATLKLNLNSATACTAVINGAVIT
jgi:hypothetical protein